MWNVTGFTFDISMNKPKRQQMLRKRNLGERKGSAKAGIMIKGHTKSVAPKKVFIFNSLAIFTFLILFTFNFQERIF